MNKRVSNSLRLQLFCAVLISFGVAVGVFFVSFLIGNTLLNRTVYGDAFTESMADQQFSLLQTYVEDEKVSLGNLQRLNAWCSRGEKVYLTVYNNDVLVYESPFSDKVKGELNIQEYDPAEEDQDHRYDLTLWNGTEVPVFLYYYAGDAFYFWMTALSGLIAFLAFSFCFVTLINRKVDYITKLQEELDILSSGQLEYTVTVSGTDELSELASGIDQMRRSIIKHQEVENQMRSANSELITAMSHDLRTPLTSLLAYLEIIERKKYTSEEQMDSLVRKSVNQTMRIKRMADKMFEYFLAYATEWESAELETVEADPLFQQIFDDYAYALESKGLQVETEFLPVSAHIRVNPELLQRAMDNLYSNLLKYADAQSAIRFTYQKQGNELCLSISNGISAAREKRESTSIGLITCRRIIGYHKGTFDASEVGDRFCVTVSLPLVQEKTGSGA